MLKTGMVVGVGEQDRQPYYLVEALWQKSVKKGLTITGVTTSTRTKKEQAEDIKYSVGRL